MPKQSSFKTAHKLGRVYFKEWRKHRRLTQAQVADRIDTTKTRVSMKENMKEPYDQFYLEALAEALTTDPASLLMRNPLDGAAIWSIWDQAKPAEREMIERAARGIAGRTGTEN